jgi:type II secretory pathway pseudopilin PulG
MHGGPPLPKPPEAAVFAIIFLIMAGLLARSIQTARRLRARIHAERSFAASVGNALEAARQEALELQRELAWLRSQAAGTPPVLGQIHGEEAPGVIPIRRAARLGASL